LAEDVHDGLHVHGITWKGVGLFGGEAPLHGERSLRLQRRGQDPLPGGLRKRLAFEAARNSNQLPELDTPAARSSPRQGEGLH
jgi:hypothetical protein